MDYTRQSSLRRSMALNARARASRSSIFVHVAILMMYASSTVITVILWVVVRNAFILNSTPEDTLAYMISNPFLGLLGIALPIWRCWAVWNKEIKMIVLPTICSLVGIVIAPIEIWMELRLGLVTTANATRPILALAQTYIVLVLVSQLSATLLIIYRIFTVARGQTAHKYMYARVVEMVVESAAPNCILLIVLLPFMADPFGASYPQAILVQSVGIGPTLIAARVAFGMARPDDEWSGTTNSVLGSKAPQGLGWKTLTRISTSALVASHRIPQDLHIFSTSTLRSSKYKLNTVDFSHLRFRVDFFKSTSQVKRCAVHVPTFHRQFGESAQALDRRWIGAGDGNTAC
ncbi:hypothetical protein K438DRAFT_1946393 [Mycena galopus ATCC 62051]|nr:hypothetical protein K438DRAFT_1946393 [Mycena galopus ATCC 62051]